MSHKPLNPEELSEFYTKSIGGYARPIPERGIDMIMPAMFIKDDINITYHALMVSVAYLGHYNYWDVFEYFKDKQLYWFDRSDGDHVKIRPWDTERIGRINTPVQPKKERKYKLKQKGFY